MKSNRYAGIFIVCLAFYFCGWVVVAQESARFPLPNKAQLAWQKAELGVIFHYDLHVFDNEQYSQPENRIKPVPDYNIFNPEKLDTEQWIKAAKDMGATFALLTATHETGFALYQSEVNPYCLKAIKWRDGKGDIVADFVNSCRKYGIKPGIYLGIRWNSFFGVHDFRVNGEGEFRNSRQKYYNRMIEEMVREICTGYGDLFEIWFDGGASDPDRGAPDVLPIVKKYQPDCLFYHNSQLAEARWGGSETGTVGYPCWATFAYPSTDQELYSFTFEDLKHGHPDGKYWMPAMADAPLRGYDGRHEWFWEPGDEPHIYPLSNLVEMFYESVGRNSTLIIGLTPDPSGLLPKPDVKRLKEFGDEIHRRFSNPLFSGRGSGNEILIRSDEPVWVNLISIREDIAQGERVRSFFVEGFTGDGWQKILQGSCIGNRFMQSFETIQISKIRVTIDQSIAEPVLSEISLYLTK